jgi:hypothetical protein
LDLDAPSLEECSHSASLVFIGSRILGERSPRATRCYRYWRISGARTNLLMIMALAFRGTANVAVLDDPCRRRPHELEGGERIAWIIP